MRTLSLALALLAGALLAAMALVPLTASARPLPCSGRPDIWRDSDVIVGGWFLGWHPEKGANTKQSYEVDIDMQVEQVFKGSAPSEIRLVETLLFRRPDQPAGQEWMGGGAACGAFDRDPSGSYGIIGLRDNGDGTYRASSLLRLYIGPGPSGPDYEQALERLAPWAPDAGNAGLVAANEGTSWAAWASLAALLLAAPAFAGSTVWLAARTGRR